MEDMLIQVTEPSDNLALTEVNMMLDQLEESHQTFRNEHSWLVSHWPSAHLDHSYFAEKVSLTESKLVLKIKRLLGRLKEQLTLPAQTTAPGEAGTRTRSRLPELTVPTFSGDIRKWPDFKAMFMSVIGDRSDLTDLKRFQYLKTAMQGDASELIVNLTPDPSSYATAWRLLNARFENKRLIIKSHLKRLLNLKPMPRRQASSLTKMVNIINETTQALRTLTTEGSNDCLMVTLIVGLLDRDTRERWETSLTSTDDFPSLSMLTELLMNRARTLESIEQDATPAQSNVVKRVTPKRVSSYQFSQKAPSAQQTSQLTQQQSLYPCDCCGQDHFIVMCLKFRGCSLDARIKVVKERSLCCNCLGRHNARKCNNSRHCKPCNGSHHMMLHGADLAAIFGLSAERSQPTQDAQAAATSNT